MVVERGSYKVGKPKSSCTQCRKRKQRVRTPSMMRFFQRGSCAHSVFIVQSHMALQSLHKASARTFVSI